MKTLVLGILFILAASAYAQAPSLAGEFLEAGFGSQGDPLPQLVAQYPVMTAQFQALPGPIQNLFGDQRIELELTLKSEKTEEIGIVIENKEIKSLARYYPSEPTMRVTTDEYTLEGIAQSKDQYKAFTDAVGAGTLKYEGYDSSTQTSLAAVDFVVWVSNFFGGIFEFLGFKW